LQDTHNQLFLLHQQTRLRGGNVGVQNPLWWFYVNFAGERVKRFQRTPVCTETVNLLVRVLSCMYSDLLVPVDRGLESNSVAIEEAAGIAEESGGVIHALFVYPKLLVPRNQKLHQGTSNRSHLRS